MKIPMMMLCAAALVLAAVGLNRAGVLPSEAHASAKYQANLTWDGGATGVSQVASVTGKNQTIQFQPVKSVALPNGSQFCYRTCATSTCVPDCTKDVILNAPIVNYQVADAGNVGFTVLSYPQLPLEPIQMGADQYLAISSLDAGNPNVNLHLITKNTP